MRSAKRLFIGLFLLPLVSVQLARAQEVENRPSIEAIKVENDQDINIDGALTEKIWLDAPVAGNFTQYRPKDGGTPSQKTEVRVLYSNKYIYVGAIAYDTAPDSITATLFRRDGTELSDWIYVNIDSYNDNRTAFTFAVNPRGVQKDVFYFNDVEEDLLWDAVWEAKTSIDDRGWVAEFRIPLSQLRFTSSNTTQNWGINFQRRIARTDEINIWAPTPREDFGMVSWFGNLTGIKDLSKPLRLEVRPYASIGLTRDETLEDANPFSNQNDFNVKVGGDFKYGITSDVTLTGTINPDFGQVEADPATINLTNFEIYFDERRPFFLEGNDIFNFGSTTSQNTFRTHTNFYSRRIGRSPSGDIYQVGISGEADYEDRPNETTIIGAAKVSGKTEKGLSVGLLTAITAEEKGTYFSSSNDETGKYLIEPATNYLVSRVTKDLNNGNAQIGGFLSSVNRDLNSGYLENYLHKSAYQAGVDGQYFWNNRNWGASGSLSFSSVNGTQEAITRTQNTSAHYYDRTDSEGLSLDSSKTSLNGYFGEFSIGKYGGQGLRYSLTYSEMSPGYEINDMGFQERADYRAPHYYLEYMNVDPKYFRFYLLWLYGGHAWNFDGDLIFNYYASGAYFQLNNLWTIVGTGGLTGTFYNDRITRGGPIMQRPKDWNFSLQLTTNSTKNFYVGANTYYRRDASGEIYNTNGLSFNFRPTGYLQLELSPTIVFERNTDQYVDYANIYAEAYGYTDRYIFSSIDLNYFMAEFRLDYTFSSTMSLQTYIRPLVVTGNYYGFKEFNEPGTYNFDEYDEESGEIVMQDECYGVDSPSCYLVDANADGTIEYAFQNPDFDYKTIQGNMVLRWEFRPGSTVYLVWQQQREGYFFKTTEFMPFNSVGNIFDQKPINIFLLKFSYWFGT